MNFVFLDTNIFLHCHPIEDIDFCKIIVESELQIIILHCVLLELDEKKYYGKTARIRKSAKDVTDKIEKWLADKDVAQIRHGTTISIDTDPENQNCDTRSQDSKIIETIRLFKNSHTNDRIVYISNDISARMIAKSCGIERIKIPGEYLLPKELDPIEKENQELKRQILEFENTRPKISLMVNEQPENNIVLTLKPIPDIPTPKSLEYKRQNIPPIEPPRSTPDSCSKEEFMQNLRQHIVGDLSVPDSEYQRYEKERQKYFKEYQKYLEDVDGFKQLRFARICFEANNIGSAPATNIDIHIHFPDGFLMCETLPGFPKQPTLPVPPQSEIEKARIKNQETLSRIANINFCYNRNISSQICAPNTFSLKKTHSYDVKDHFLTLKHGTKIKIPALFIVYSSADSLKGFKAEYQISANELPEETTGTLNFKVTIE